MCNQCHFLIGSYNKKSRDWNGFYGCGRFCKGNNHGCHGYLPESGQNGLAVGAILTMAIIHAVELEQYGYIHGIWARVTSTCALQASIQALTLQVQTLSSKKYTAPRSDKSHTPNDACKGIGHTLDECWKLGGGRQGQYPPWWKGKQDAPMPSSANLATANMSSSKADSVYTNVTTLNMRIDGETLEAIEKVLREETALVVIMLVKGL